MHFGLFPRSCPSRDRHAIESLVPSDQFICLSSDRILDNRQVLARAVCHASKHAVVDHHVLEVAREAPCLMQTSRPDTLLRITHYKHCRPVYLIQASKPYPRTVTLTCSMAPSRFKLVDTCHVPSSVTLNPRTRTSWVNMSTDDKDRGLLYKLRRLPAVHC